MASANTTFRKLYIQSLSTTFFGRFGHRQLEDTIICMERKGVEWCLD